MLILLGFKALSSGFLSSSVLLLSLVALDFTRTKWKVLSLLGLKVESLKMKVKYWKLGSCHYSGRHVRLIITVNDFGFGLLKTTDFRNTERGKGSEFSLRQNKRCTLCRVSGVTVCISSTYTCIYQNLNAGTLSPGAGKAARRETDNNNNNIVHKSMTSEEWRIEFCSGLCF